MSTVKQETYFLDPFVRYPAENTEKRHQNRENVVKLLLYLKLNKVYKKSKVEKAEICSNTSSFSHDFSDNEP